jgi:hypothetical protein
MRVGTARAQEEFPDDPESRPELPAADFDFLVYSLRLQAELSLGNLPLEADPGEEKPAPDFELARHNIDLLAMLQEKTRGNLTVDEQRAVDNTLSELRFHYVQALEVSTGTSTGKSAGTTINP